MNLTLTVTVPDTVQSEHINYDILEQAVRTAVIDSVILTAEQPEQVEIEMSIKQESEFEASDVYESFQNTEKCRELVRMLLNSGLLGDILAECAEYVADDDYNNFSLNQ